MKNQGRSMDKRKIGVTLVVITLLLGIVLVNLITDSSTIAKEKGCFQNNECSSISYTLSASHLGIGILFALLSLGIYLVIFGRTEERLLQQLEQQNQQLSREDKLKIVALLLSENEKKVFNTILEHEGITQNTLRIKTDLSKATVSQILADFEKKNIIKKESKGKTYSIFLKADF